MIGGENGMEWKCSRCQTENKDTYICPKCGLDESKNYIRYASITILQEKDKIELRNNFKKSNILMSSSNIAEIFGKRINRKNVKSIQIFNHIPPVTESAWDVSESKDGSVLAWVMIDEDGWSHLYLAADGDIIANRNCAGLFCGYSELENIQGINYLKTDDVTDMGWMFAGCHNLLELDVSSFCTEKVINMSSMFFECFKLKTLNINNFELSNVTDMSWMFGHCSDLILSLSEECKKKLLEIPHIFETVTINFKLKNMHLENMDVKNESDEVGKNLNQVGDQKKKSNKLMACPDTMSVFGMKTKRDRIRFIHIQNTLDSVDELAWDVSADKDGSVMAWLVKDENGRDSLYLAADGNIIANENCSGLFNGYSELEDIEGMEFFRTDEVIDMSWMFASCYNLKKLNISIFNTKKVTNMKYLFAWCSSLSNIDISNFDTRNVTDMEGMFVGCVKMTMLNTDNLDTANVTNMRLMFNCCSSLKNINLDNLNIWNVTDMRDIFEKCDKLSKMEIVKFKLRPRKQR